MYEKKRLFYQGDKKTLDGILHRQVVDFFPNKRWGNVLDYGAGNSPYRDYIDCDFYRTVDINQNAACDIDYLLSGGPGVPLADKSVDLILLMDVLEHVREPGPILIELRRLLSNGGRLIISLPFIYREHETPSDFYRYTLFGIQELISSHSGRIIKVAKVGNFWYTFLSLFMERKIYYGERNKLGLFGRIINKLLRGITPLLSPWLKYPPDMNACIYHHLLLEVEFS